MWKHDKFRDYLDVFYSLSRRNDLDLWWSGASSRIKSFLNLLSPFPIFLTVFLLHQEEQVFVTRVLVVAERESKLSQGLGNSHQQLSHRQLTRHSKFADRL